MKDLFEPQEVQTLPVNDSVLLHTVINGKFKQVVESILATANEEHDRERRETLAILETVTTFIKSKMDCDHAIVPFNAHPELAGGDRDLRCTKCGKVWETIRMIPGKLPNFLSGSPGGVGGTGGRS